MNRIILGNNPALKGKKTRYPQKLMEETSLKVVLKTKVLMLFQLHQLIIDWRI